MVAAVTPPRRRRLNTDTVVLIGLFLLFVFVSFQVASRTATPESRLESNRRTTYSARPGGWKAFYLLLQEEGAAVYRWEKEPRTWPKDARVVITGPEYFSLANTGGIWDKVEAADAIKWVKAGGTLILFADDFEDLLEKFELTVTSGDKSASSKDKIANLPLAQPVYIKDVHSIVVPGESRWSAFPASAVTLLTDKNPVGMVIPIGSGLVFAFSAPGMADNEHIAQGDNARLLTRIVIGAMGDKKRGVGRVLFDEYHQGYQSAESIWAAVGRPGQLAALQVLVLTLLVAYSAGRRFGLPRPMPAPSRVSSEYVTSLADLYRRAGAGDAVHDGLVTAFRRDLCRSLGLPVDASAPEIAARASRGRIDPQQALETRLSGLLESVSPPPAGKKSAVLKDDDLLRFAREIDDLRKELQLGGSR